MSFQNSSHLATHIKNLIEVNIHDENKMENVFRYILYNNLKYKWRDGLKLSLLHEYSVNTDPRKLKRFTWSIFLNKNSKFSIFSMI